MKQSVMAMWLKGITIVLGGMCVIFFGVLVPFLAYDCKRAFSEVAYLFWPGLIYGWSIGLLCFAALYQFFKICVQIGRDNSFSIENAKSLSLIGKLGIFAALEWFAGIVALIILKCIAPGIIILMIVAVIVSASVSIASIALSHLVMKAYELKQENEYTI